MTKAELIASIAEKSGLSKSDVEKAFSATFDVITQKLAEKQKIMIPGFGGFSTKERAGREGRNPKAGEKMMIPPATTANFKPATQLKETINS
jgi:DNA-binding protein HU-beta